MGKSCSGDGGRNAVFRRVEDSETGAKRSKIIHSCSLSYPGRYRGRSSRVDPAQSY